MARTVSLSAGRDVTARGNFPDSYYTTANKLWTNLTGRGYIYFTMPFNPGVTVLSAKLHLFAGKKWPDNRTITVKRITQSFAFENANWHWRPPVGEIVATAKRANTISGDEWVLDVTAQVARIAAGESWWGWEISSDSVQDSNIHGLLSPYPRLRPHLEITWAENPLPPNDLQPRGNGVVSLSKPTLMFNFIDSEGVTSMGGYQIQIDPNANWAAPAFDFAQNSTVPQCNLAATAYPGLAEGTGTWWRVRVKDADGLWSGWSAPVSFLFLSKSALDITSPVGSFTDATPTVEWTFAGAQTRYEVSVYNRTETRWMWGSGTLAGAATSFTVPAGVITRDGAEYTIFVAVNDDQNRVPMPGEDVRTVAFENVVWQRSNTIPLAEDLSVVTLEGYQDVRWRMSDTTGMDYFGVWRDGVLIAYAPVDSFQRSEDGDFGFVDREAPPREEHTWQIMTVSSTGSSENGPQLTKMVRYNTPWLSGREDGSIPIPLVNAVVDPGLYEDTDVVIPLNGNPVIVKSSVKGYIGSCSAELADDVGELSAREYKNVLLSLRSSVQECSLVWADQSITCYIYGLSITPQSSADGRTHYYVAFSFLQTGGGQ